MPQERTLLHRGAARVIERVVSYAPADCWSARYEAPTQRLMLPVSGFTEFRLAQEVPVMLDSVTVLRLPAGLQYQMNPSACGSPESTVVSDNTYTTRPAPQPAVWVLPARAVWHLRRYWHFLARCRDLAGLAAALGYSSQSHMEKIFRAELGLPRPRQCRPCRRSPATSLDARRGPSHSTA